MAGGNKVFQQRFLLGPAGWQPVQPIGTQRLHAAQAQPVMVRRGIAEKIKHDRLMIAGKADAADTGKRPRGQPGEHGR